MPEHDKWLLIAKEDLAAAKALVKVELFSAVAYHCQQSFDAANYINPFSTKFRYPTEFDIPTLSDAQIAIKHAENIINFVIKKISVPATTQITIFKN